MPLTNTAIINSKPKDKPYRLTDEKGLYLLVQNTGGKLWRFDYRYLGNRKTISMGSYPEVSLVKARERRDVARRLLANEPPVDPSENRKASKASSKLSSDNSFEVIAREWWQSYMKNKAPSHKDKVIRRFELYLFPWIGDKPIADITAPQMLEVVKRIEKLNKNETAHRALQTSGQVFRYAVQTGRAIRDVTADLKGALSTTSVKHMAAFTDPKQIAELLNAIDGFNGTLTVQCALKLSPLVFVRPSELRQARWKDINLEAAEW